MSDQEAAEQPIEVVVELLRDLVAWQRFTTRDQLRRKLAETLTTENDKAVYELTNGEFNQTDIARQVGIARPSVGRKWADWRTRGLLGETQDPKKPRHLLSLEAIGGLPVPD